MRGQRETGFSLVEIMAVMAIIGVMLLAIVPNLDNQVPAYRLRAGAREVASTMELAQSEAVAKRKEYAILYDLDRETYTLILPPADPDEESEGEEPAEGEGLLEGMGGEKSGPRPRNDLEHGPPPPAPTDPDAAEEEEEAVDYSERETLSEKRLPEDVIFELVVVGEDEHRSGRVYVPFTHLSNGGAHYVGVTLDPQQSLGEAEKMWVKFNPLTRTIEYSSGQPQIRTLEPGEGE